MIRKTLYGVFNFLVAFLLITVCSQLIVNMVNAKRNPNYIPSYFGYIPLSVLSGSMRPIVEPGDMIMVKKTSPQNIKAGDVITYRADDNVLITHRVTDIVLQGDGYLFKTRGDSNNIEDENLVYSGQLVGIMAIRLPYGGFIISAVRSPIGILVLIILIAFILLSGTNIISFKKGKHEKSYNFGISLMPGLITLANKLSIIINKDVLQKMIKNIRLPFIPLDLTPNANIPGAYIKRSERHRKKRKFTFLKALLFIIPILLLPGIDGTHTWFTAQQVNSNNVFQTGTLKLDLYNSASYTQGVLINATNQLPGGAPAELNPLIIKNTGTLPLKFKVDTGLTITDASSSAPKVLQDNGNSFLVQYELNNASTLEKTLPDFINTLDSINDVPLQPNDEYKITARIKLADTATNDYQNVKTVTTITVLATQDNASATYDQP